jgi:hypothetical protein
MALLAESTELAFANPYKNPYESEFSPTPTKAERHLSGSSTEYSQYNEKDDWDLEEVYAKKEKGEGKYKQDVKEQALPFQNVTAPDALRTLSIHHPSWCRKDMIVKDDGGKTIYFADVARYTRAPDITLHRGEQGLPNRRHCSFQIFTASANRSWRSCGRALDGTGRDEEYEEIWIFAVPSRSHQ